MAQAASHLPLVGDKFDGIADAIGGAREKIQGLKDDMYGLGEETDKAAGKAGGLAGALGRVKDAAGGGGLAHILQFAGGVGHRAAGGPVSAGSPYIVGERGPELFVPGTSGTIVPGVGGPVFNISVSALDPGSAATAVVRAIEEYESRHATKFARTS